jgi:hypothetical protein
MRVLSFMAVLGLAACSSETSNFLPDDHLPDAAVEAFQLYVEQLSNDTLDCDASAIRAAPRVSGDLNSDGQRDFAIDAGQLTCDAPANAATSFYFCGGSTCAYPALMSKDDGWIATPLMSGNEIEVVEHYRDTRFRVRQMDFGSVSRETILVRDYAWRDGELIRVAASHLVTAEES